MSCYGTPSGRVRECLVSVIMSAVVVFTAIWLSEGSNLWPLLLIVAAPVATVYLLVLRLAERRVTGQR